MHPDRSNTTISACSFNLRMRAAAVAPPATPPTMTTFISMLHLSCISGDAADIFDVGIPHALQHADRLSASGSAMAVDKHERILIIYEAGHLVKRLQRHILAAGDMALPVFLRCSDIQQDRAGRCIVFPDALTNVGSFQKVKKSHIHVLLTAWPESAPWASHPPFYWQVCRSSSPQGWGCS